MFYIDVLTNWKIGVTKIKQEDWLVENGIIDVKHIKTSHIKNVPNTQYNRWRFADETDAMAFKLVWV